MGGACGVLCSAPQQLHCFSRRCEKSVSGSFPQGVLAEPVTQKGKLLRGGLYPPLPPKRERQERPENFKKKHSSSLSKIF